MLWVLKKNHLNEMALLSTQNIIMLKLMGKKIFTILYLKNFVYRYAGLFEPSLFAFAISTKITSAGVG